MAVTGPRVDYLRALHWAAQKRTSPTLPRLEVAMGGSDMALLNRVRYLIGLKPIRTRVCWWPAGLTALLALAGLWCVVHLSSAVSSPAFAAEPIRDARPPARLLMPRPHDQEPAVVRPDSEGASSRFAWLSTQFAPFASAGCAAPREEPDPHGVGRTPTAFNARS